MVPQRIEGVGISPAQLCLMNIRNMKKLRQADVALTRLQRVASLVYDSKQHAIHGCSMVPDELLEELIEAAKPIGIQQ